MARRKDSEYSRSTIIADAVGLTHLLVATAIVILGEYTNLFVQAGGRYNGVEFVYKYLDLPVYQIVTPILESFGVAGDVSDRGVAMVTAGFVIIASSVVYGVITYYVCRLIASLAASDN